MAYIHISKDPPDKAPFTLGHKPLYRHGGISRVEEIYGKL